MSPLKRVTIQTRRGLLIIVVALAFLSLPTAAVILSSNADTTCKRIHKIVTQGAQIIDGRARLGNQLKLGLINRAQYAEGMEETAHALKVWRTADCPPS